MTDFRSYHNTIEDKPLPHELLVRYRQRSRLSQTELAELIGLKSERMLRYWEGGYSLPAADRLQKLIELYLERQVFRQGQEHEEVYELWRAVKDMYDLSRKRLETYPVFDEGWFSQITHSVPPPAKAPLVTPQHKEPVTPAALPDTLPVELTRLIGREKVVQEVVGLLGREEVRLLTLTGPGGTGKTRLSVKVAATLRPEFKDGVFFVALAGVSNPDLVESAIARTLEITESTTSLKSYLHKKQMLLVLDNFEQIIDAAETVKALLAGAPGLKVLVTSRAVLRLSAEYEYKVPPLSLPDPTQSLNETLSENFEAVQLFVERARAVKPDFTLTAENRALIYQICNRLDGLPLALELAAARIRLLPLAVLLERLNARPLNVLTGGARDLPVRQQTLRNTLDWSYALLTRQEQRLLNRLGIFAGSFSLAAVEEICRPFEELQLDALDGLGSLLEKSLVKQAVSPGEEPRFMLLETIREYALEKLTGERELVKLRQSHSRYYHNLAAIVTAKQPPYYDAPNWLEEVELDHDNLTLAFEELEGEAPAAVSKAKKRKGVTEVVIELDIKRPVEEVFDYITDTNNMPYWNQNDTMQILVHNNNPNKLEPGMELRSTTQFLGRTFEVLMTVADYERPYFMRVRSITGPIKVVLELYLAATTNGTHLKMWAEISADSVFKLVAPIMTPLLKKELEAGMSQLKVVMEQKNQRLGRD